MSCYLWKSTSFHTRKGQVRDAPDLKILECTHCGLEYLSSLDHIQSGFYEESGMHGNEAAPMSTWLKDCERDDQRSFDMLKRLLTNKKLLDFGCGAGSFLNIAQHHTDSNVGKVIGRCGREYWNEEFLIHPDFDNAILIGDKARDIQAGNAAVVVCNSLLADTAPVKLHDTIYQRVTSLGDTLPFLVCGQSRVIAQ